MGHLTIFEDDFAAARGKVIGTAGKQGGRWSGVDVEDVLSVRDGELHFAPLSIPGFGRAGISSPAFLSRPGIVFAVRLINAHTSSETLPVEPIRGRIRTWVTGSQVDPLPTRLRGFVRHRHREAPIRRVRRWVRSRSKANIENPIFDNQIVGLFATTVPTGVDDLVAGVITRALGPENGAYVAAGPDGESTELRGVGNVTTTFAVIIREDDAVIAVAAIAGNGVVDDEPGFSPIAVVPFTYRGPLYAGVHQSVMGQHGFSIDTCVDKFVVAEVRTPGERDDSEAVGLVRLPGNRNCGLHGRDLSIARVGGKVTVTWQEHAIDLAMGEDAQVALLPDRIVLTAGAMSRTLSTGARPPLVGLSGDTDLAELLPASLDLGLPQFAPDPHPTTETVVTDDFVGIGSLAGRQTPSGPWRRLVGAGEFRLAADGLHVQASPASPVPGRTAFTVPWSHPDYADLTISLTPPGAGRGDGHHCRTGLVFAADDDNQLLINAWLDDSYGGASVSSFTRLEGHEEVYDAVWANVGDAIAWGRSTELRVTFDGSSYCVFLDGRAVLERSLRQIYAWSPRLPIAHVGIVANWEWGLDTGSHIHHFDARRLCL